MERYKIQGTGHKWAEEIAAASPESLAQQLARREDLDQICCVENEAGGGWNPAEFLKQYLKQAQEAL